MLRSTCWVGLAIVALSSGCTHNYYYGTAGCPPLGQAVTTQVGQVCEVPGATVVTSSAAAPVVGPSGTAAQVASGPQRVVISQPAYSPNFLGRRNWHRVDPEGVVATTRSEGALQETTNR